MSAASEVIDLTLDNDSSSDSELECVGDSRNFTNAKLQRDSELLKILHTRFAGTVRMDPRGTALQVATSEYTKDRDNRLVFWSDASIRNGADTGYGAGISVVWRGKLASHGWQNKTYILHGYFNTNEAEFFGIAEAMKIAAAMVKSSDPVEGYSRATKVVIYSDNQGCLRWVKDFETVGPVRQYSITRQRELAILKKRAKALVDMGVDLELRWVPGHSGVQGNTMADTLAGRASRFGGSVFGGLRYDHLEPIADAYLQAPPRDVVLKRRSPHPARITKRATTPTFHMRLRSANPARVAGAGLQQSLSPTPKIVKQGVTRTTKLAGKKMERFHQILQMQAKDTMISGSLSITRRSPSPATRQFTRAIMVDGVAKKVADRPPPPPLRPLQPRTVIIEEDPQEVQEELKRQPQKKRRTWDRLKILLKLDD